MSNYLVIMFAFIVLLSWGIGDFLIQRTIHKIGSWGTLFWLGTLGGFFLLPFCSKDWHNFFIFSNFLELIVLSALFILFSYLIFEALDRGKLAVVELIITLELPITVILGLLFFKEKISWAQAFLILLIFISIILIAKKSVNWWTKICQRLGCRRNFLEKGVVLALFAAVISALTNFNTASSARQVGPLATIAFVWLVNAIVAFAIIYSRGQWEEFIHKSQEIKSLVAAMSFFDTLAWMAFSLATWQGELSLVIAIAASYPAVSIFLAVKFNKEKISKIQYVGAVSALVVSFILAIMSR